MGAIVGRLDKVEGFSGYYGEIELLGEVFEVAVNRDPSVDGRITLTFTPRGCGNYSKPGYVRNAGLRS